MPEIHVRHEEGDRFTVGIGDHEIVVDQPVHQGGGNAGPTPTELFVASLAACVGFFAERFLARHGLPTTGLAVDASYGFAVDRPSRVGRIDVRLALPEGFPERRRAALAAVVDHCTVHESMRRQMDVTIRLQETARAR